MADITEVACEVQLADDFDNWASSDDLYLGVAGRGGQEWSLTRNGSRLTGEFEPKVRIDLGVGREPYVYLRKLGVNGMLLAQATVRLRDGGRTVYYELPNVEPLWLDSANDNGHRVCLRKQSGGGNEVVTFVDARVRYEDHPASSVTNDPVYVGFMGLYGGREWTLRKPEDLLAEFSAGKGGPTVAPLVGGLGVEACDEQSVLWYVRKDGTDAAKLESVAVDATSGYQLSSAVVSGSTGLHDNEGPFWLSENRGNLVALSRSFYDADDVRPMGLTLELKTTPGVNWRLPTDRPDYVLDPQARLFLGVIGSLGGREFRLTQPDGFKWDTNHQFSFGVLGSTFTRPAPDDDYWPFGGSPQLVYLRVEGPGNFAIDAAQLTVRNGRATGPVVSTDVWSLDLRSTAVAIEESAVYFQPPAAD